VRTDGFCSVFQLPHVLDHSQLGLGFGAMAALWLLLLPALALATSLRRVAEKHLVADLELALQFSQLQLQLLGALTLQR